MTPAPRTRATTIRAAETRAPETRAGDARTAAIDAFLAAHGWAAAGRAPLAGDASARRYQRLTRGRARAVLMDLPPGSGLTAAPFLAVTAWLRGLGLSAPEIYAADPGAGLVLIEDLGDALFARLAADPAAGRTAEPRLYAAAVDLLVGLQSAPPPPAGPDYAPSPYDAATLLRELRLVPEWYLPAATGRAAPPDRAAEYEALAAPILAFAAPEVPVLRDFHAENLIWLPRRRGVARVGLLDYQDLLLGHPAYDLVSLLADARRDVAPDLRAVLAARYLARAGREPEAFAAAAAALSAQRCLKILGLFVRLARRDGKPQYLRHLPRVWGQLRRDLAHPALAPLAAWTARHLPPPEALRAAPAAAP